MNFKKYLVEQNDINIIKKKLKLLNTPDVFNSLDIAKNWVSKSEVPNHSSIYKGDGGKFWVVYKKDRAKVEEAGYEIIK